jgi:hypothetical protein
MKERFDSLYPDMPEEERQELAVRYVRKLFR